MKPETATVFYRTRVAGFDVPDVPNVDDYEAVCDVVMPAIDTDAIWAFLQGEDLAVRRVRLDADPCQRAISS